MKKAGDFLFKELKKKFGSIAEIGRQCDVPYSKAVEWGRNGVGMKYSLRVCEILGATVKPWDLYPEIYDKRLLSKYF